MAVVVVVAIIVSVIIALAVIPVAHPFSATIDSSPTGPGQQSYTFPSGSKVSGSWSTSDGGSVNFTVLGLLLNVVYSSDGSSGTFSFTALGGPCIFQTESTTTETTSVSGTYSAPIL